ncbi:Archaeal flagella assembly protein J [Archaeoglobus sulfaticallidus PM70-1]|uniref:Archaeal flagella assembly protein J n=1 Tax=Archaeoglobus sulfaticallidus PM70-1 TaxID=387631 RepID=N0BB75_9EURY|nr:archaellar assembly protein FlaJ [Archaeoglobus sulfaticallidus]AGK60859.1 Archaeal flagella assembly protein J [Archaeoglobus sulfaticallidus PM70-1]
MTEAASGFKLGRLKLFGNIIERLKSLREEMYIDNDLLFILTYMASISTAQINRDKIFEKTSEKVEYAPSKYFKKIKDLAQNWHYDYATACELIARKVKHERLKNLLNRFSNAISAGEPDRDFLEHEWKAFKTIRKDEFERSLESLKKWADAYTALLVSSSLISVIILLSVVIYKAGDPAQTLYFSVFGIFLISLFGVGMLYRSVPKDVKTHNLEVKSREQYLIKKWSPICLVLAALSFTAISVIPTMLNISVFRDYTGLGFVIAGAMILPLGMLGKIDDRKVSDRDEKFAVFIRNLGSIVSGAGVSVVEALSRIDQKNLGELKDPVNILYKRLAMGLDPKICWDRFIGECGSYIIHKLTSIFVDAVNLGGDADIVSEIVSSSNLEMVLLRMKRDLISSGFLGLIIPLHAAMASLVIFITEILTIFTQFIDYLFKTFFAKMGGSTTNVVQNISIGLNLGIFEGLPVELLHQYTFLIILAITISNTLASKIVKGGNNYLLYYYGSILLIISGIVMLVVPPIVNAAFSLPSFMEVGGK